MAKKMLDIRRPMDLLNRTIQLKDTHEPGSCPLCGLKSYKRMSDKEKRAHKAKHKNKKGMRKKAA